MRSPELFSIFNRIYTKDGRKEISIRTFERHIENLKYGGYIDAVIRSAGRGKGRYYEIDLHRPLHFIEALYQLKNDGFTIGGDELVNPERLINDSEQGNPIIIYDPIRKRLRALEYTIRDYDGKRIIPSYSPWVVPSW